MKQDRSEMLVQEFQSLQATLPQIQASEDRAVNDREIQGLVLRLVTAEKMLPVNDVRTKELQNQVKERAKSIQSPREAHRKQRAVLVKELTEFTRPVIERIVQKINRMASDLGVKKEILNTKYDGGSKRTILTVKTNQDTIRAFREKVKTAILKIQGMSLQSVAAIEEEARHFDELKDFNPDVFVEKKVDELDFYRGSSPPAGIRGGDDYIGPLSGLRE